MTTKDQLDEERQRLVTMKLRVHQVKAIVRGGLTGHARDEALKALDFLQAEIEGDMGFVDYRQSALVAAAYDRIAASLDEVWMTEPEFEATFGVDG